MLPVFWMLELHNQVILISFTEDREYHGVQLRRFLTICEYTEKKGVPVGIPHAASSAAILAFPASLLYTIQIYDTWGRQIRRLKTEYFSPGRHTISWDGHAENGLQAPSGLYFCRLATNDDHQTIRILKLN